jgi:hypothetical protein
MLDLIKLINEAKEIWYDEPLIIVDLADRGMISCEVSEIDIESKYYGTDPCFVPLHIREHKDWTNDKDLLKSLVIENIKLVEKIEA